MSNLWDDWNNPKNRKLREMYAEQDRKMQAQDGNRDAADLAALRAENVRLREALSALLDEYRVRMFAIGHTYDDIDSQVVVTESRAALAAAPAAGA